MDWSKILSDLGQSLIYSFLGMIVMGIGFLFVKLFSPFSIRKEIEEDQNTSLAIIIGSLFIAIAIIIAAAIH